jgi:hypothetical protein
MIPYKLQLRNISSIVVSLIRYNLKIIFAGKFIYFLGAALGVFILVSSLNVLNPNITITSGMVFGLLLIPGILLVFYPSVFGIQNDVDTRMIEILFGIPNYRYKVWLLRMILMFLMTAVIIMILGFVCSLLIANISVLDMTFQVMVPVLFFGSIAFMFSTVVANGSGTAVVMIIAGIGLWIAQVSIGTSKWNPILNPYNIPQNMNETIWAGLVTTNRVYLLVVVIAALLAALLNLQKRERFI